MCVLQQKEGSRVMAFTKSLIVAAVVLVLVQGMEAQKHGHREFEISYGVKDTHTGDYKSLHESRDGNKVRGEYRVAQPDGLIRIVQYGADGKDDFRANVFYVPGLKNAYQDRFDDE